MVQIRNPEEGETRLTGVEPYRARRGRARGAGSSAPGSDGNSVGATTNLLLSLFFFKEKLNFMSNYECLGKLPKTQPLSPCSLKLKKKGKKKTLSSHLPCPTPPVPWSKNQGRAQAGRWRVDSHRAPNHPPIRCREKISPKETTQESDTPGSPHWLRAL